MPQRRDTVLHPYPCTASLADVKMAAHTRVQLLMVGCAAAGVVEDVV